MKEVILDKLLSGNGLVWGFAVVALTLWVGYLIGDVLLAKRIRGTAISLVLGLVLAYVGGVLAKGSQGLANIPAFSGLGLMGGAMLRDYAIVSTAYGAKFEELKKAGLIGLLSLLLGIVGSFVVGVVLAYAMGVRNPEDLTTIGAGTCTFIVGPVTGAAVKASSAAVTLSIAAGIVKAIVAILVTPLVAKRIGLTTPAAAMVFGGFIGSNTGVMGGLAATDPALVPYGAITATFYTGTGCLLCPSIGYMIVKAIFG
ncbi:MAG: malonate transporter subunit MadM [Firmicutes bacterium]|jgi:malonate transporter MadM subunit|nr:malonate transporter subunit MadM [Bacillota bacterium]